MAPRIHLATLRRSLRLFCLLELVTSRLENFLSCTRACYRDTPRNRTRRRTGYLIQTVLVSVLFHACAICAFRASNEAYTLPEEARNPNCDRPRLRS